MIAHPIDLGAASTEWQGASVTLRAERSSSNATLTIEFEGPGALWLDRVYLIGADAVLGIWRQDVVKALQDLNPGVIRFGGSTLEVFEWDKCLGHWDKRAPYVTQPWGGLDPNFIGVEEFVQLTRHVGAEPLICVRWTGKTPKDAEAEVEYFNGGPETYWGKVRAQNGHPEPYRIKYWQIGNEIGGQEYDASVKAFAVAMKQADASIKILSSFPSADTLRLGGGYLDYLCPHHYDAGDLVSEERSFENLQDQISRYSGGRDVRVAVTEWNTTAGEMGLTRGILLTLGNALSCSRYQNLMHRYSGLVEIAIRSNLSDSFGSGIIQPGAGWLYQSPTYHSQWLYQRAAGTFPLRIERSGGVAAHLREPDVSATLSGDGETLRIFSVNSTSKPRRTRISLTGLPGVSGGKWFVLGDREHAGDSEAMNSHDDPGRVAILSGETKMRGPEFEYVFEPFTVTLLELHLKSR
jgi:alpha-N-arabinofuranosidase